MNPCDQSIKNELYIRMYKKDGKTTIALCTTRLENDIAKGIVHVKDITQKWDDKTEEFAIIELKGEKLSADNALLYRFLVKNHDKLLSYDTSNTSVNIRGSSRYKLKF